MLERKHKGVLSLNLKKLASRFDDLKIILILQNEILLLMLFCKRVLKQREGNPDYQAQKQSNLELLYDSIKLI